VSLAGVEADGRRLIFLLGDGTPAGDLVARLATVASLRDLAAVEPDIEDVISRLYQSQPHTADGKKGR
jgi:ABC-2 type transport system ATP-binding protein